MGDDTEYTALKLEEVPAQCVKGDLNPSKTDHKIRDGLYQSVVSLGVLSNLLHNGMFYTFSTILYRQLDATKHQNACIASFLMIGAILGSLSIGPISDRIGRKRTCFLAATLTSATWAGLMSLPKSFDLVLIYIIRLISGFSMCLAFVSIVYVSEVTNKHWRPMFLGMGGFFMSIGVPLSAVVGSMMPWRSYALVNFVISLFNILVLIPLPESPHWLFPSQPERAKRILMTLNKNTEDFNEEWKAMEARRSNKESNLGRDVTMTSQEVRRPMICMAIILLCQQFGGVYIITSYALQILNTITQSPIWSPTVTSVNVSLPIPNPPEKHQFQLSDVDTLCFIGVGVIRVVMSGLCAVLSRFIDSKHILIWTSAGGAVSAFLFAVTFSGVFGPVSILIPLALLLLFQVFETCGMQSIPWAQVGQLIPLSYRAKGSGILTAYACSLTFITFMGFPYAMDLLGLSYIFVFFGVVATLACFFVYFYIPETRGKTFVEIEECFK